MFAQRIAYDENFRAVDSKVFYEKSELPGVEYIRNLPELPVLSEILEKNNDNADDEVQDVLDSIHDFLEEYSSECEMSDDERALKSFDADESEVLWFGVNDEFSTFILNCVDLFGTTLQIARHSDQHFPNEEQHLQEIQKKLSQLVSSALGTEQSAFDEVISEYEKSSLDEKFVAEALASVKIAVINCYELRKKLPKIYSEYIDLATKLVDVIVTVLDNVSDINLEKSLNSSKLFLDRLGKAISNGEPLVNAGLSDDESQSESEGEIISFDVDFSEGDPFPDDDIELNFEMLDKSEVNPILNPAHTYIDEKAEEESEEIAEVEVQPDITPEPISEVKPEIELKSDTENNNNSQNNDKNIIAEDIDEKESVKEDSPKAVRRGLSKFIVADSSKNPQTLDITQNTVVPNETVNNPEQTLETVDTDETTDVSVIESYLGSLGIVIMEKHLTGVTDGVSMLVKLMSDSLPVAEEFIHKLRVATTSETKKLNYDLKSYSAEDKKTITKLATTLQECGIFTDFMVKGSNMHGTISSSSRVVNFINGRWTEIFAQKIIYQAVSKFAEENKLPYEVYSNVKVVKTDKEVHEIDLIFSIGEIVFATEQKSGANFMDYDKYRELAEWLGLPPERFLLINSSITSKDVMECIRYFYEYFVCNTQNSKEVLLEMINLAFSNK